jgi:oligopeptide/dipeptide ABC transporter ATP-binding protein
MVGLDEVDRIANAFPHELSGGQQQRIALAQALVCDPSVVIADEPTASLDSVTSARILDLLSTVTERSCAMLLTSHDPLVLHRLADRVAVMYAAQLVETGSADDVLGRPCHPYTVGLLRSAPQHLRAGGERRQLAAIAGAPPDPTAFPDGCRFAPRCPRRLPHCASQVPALMAVGEAHCMACFNPE